MLDAVDLALQIDRRWREGETEIVALRKRYSELSQRERQVMALGTTGLLNSRSQEFSLSEVTVKIHRGSAMRKMNARTLADLVKIAGLLELNQDLQVT
ncbi:FixJ family two-component response regulator [Rhizobium tibeticum]|uniref:response regulator transcription factor n=1 Tax=Rhizobium tibeticum TaxID=501024 RepID=UPI002785025B|nr:LuxR C-terminal-related transcriptional regulator [Rhizobium tibeticum]MDP9810045.1 FixJ family two-component response regulator [Rhizobium tibeticum]